MVLCQETWKVNEISFSYQHQLILQGNTMIFYNITINIDISTNVSSDDVFWRDMGFQELKDTINMQKDAINTKQAKNVILFIGDGMSNPTITAARIFKGIQEKNPYPERGYLSFERFPHHGRIKVNQLPLTF